MRKTEVTSVAAFTSLRRETSIMPFTFSSNRSCKFGLGRLRYAGLPDLEPTIKESAHAGRKDTREWAARMMTERRIE